MRTLHRGSCEGLPGRSPGALSVACIAIALTSTACASSTNVRRPSEPLSTGQSTWPETVVKDAERVDRVCGAREAKLLADYQEGKQEQEKLKTILGSITGGVGTVGGVVGGVGAYAIHSQDTMKTVTGVTGFVGAGLGAVGTVVALVVSPGKAKIEGANNGLASLDQKRAAARDVLKKDPTTWSNADKEAWAKAAKDLESTCK